ncbi:Bug family tripartite tricarboxylate transporter substrate binding protein [Roseococcus sp. DSY-14]|uniref:Bug family tripartite tricarboxylate transporter substrate binding protein n=1 Tax=Roseococcus sp. DSY-14 TaxID=3369650 RepID=UPI00387B8BD1
MMTAPRRALLALPLATPALAQGWAPARPIRYVVNFPPGGTADLVGRAMEQALPETLGQPVVVENRGGAGGVLGTEQVARAAPDGHTLGQVLATHATTPALLPSLPFDPVRDFQPLSMVARMSTVVLVAPSSPIRTVADLLAAARANRDGLAYASPGVGVIAHLAGALLQQVSGANLVHVPYRGGGPALTDLMAGNVPVMFNGFGGSVPHVREGRVRAIAVTSARRSATLPEVPTMAEQGFPQIELYDWFGVVAPARTPPAATERLFRAVVEATRNAALRQRLEAAGLEVMASASPDEFGGYIAAEIERWGALIRAAGIRADG